VKIPLKNSNNSNQKLQQLRINNFSVQDRPLSDDVSRALFRVLLLSSCLKKNPLSAERRLYCGILFWLKVLLALGTSIGLMAFFGLRLKDLRNQALAKKALADIQNPPIKIPILPGSIQCSTNSSTTRLLLNGSDKMYMGFSLDFQPENRPADIAQVLNNRLPSLFNAFYRYPSTWSQDMLRWHASLLQKLGHGPIYQLSIDPDDYATMTDEAYDAIAVECAYINSEYGVPILLRWGHEMNGNWYAHGYQPTAYVASFRKLATAMRARTNVTALLWSPNIGNEYPFGGGIVPAPTGADLLALDTNGSGALNVGDGTPLFLCRLG
jgi:hypothetical protein